MTDRPAHHRRSIRLADYDYAQAGAYFVTICVAGGACLLGAIVDGEMQLNEYGRIVHDEWARTSAVRLNVTLDVSVVMPNHIHGIITINETNAVGATRRVAPTGPAPGSISAIIGQFKSIVTKRINILRGTQGTLVWQRNYYEHIIRSVAELDRIRRYILDNPARWPEDTENPAVVARGHA